MPEFIMPIENYREWEKLSPFVQGYIEAAFFTECHSDNPELEDATFEDIESTTLQGVIEDCEQWLAALPRDGHGRTPLDLATDYASNDYDETRAGHDFWLTRNGHGAGFWDRGLGAVGETLSDYARNAGEVYLMRGDSGAIYFE